MANQNDKKNNPGPEQQRQRQEGDKQKQGSSPVNNPDLGQNRDDKMPPDRQRSGNDDLDVDIEGDRSQRTPGSNDRR